jgi:membrane-associated phospholipid phosphatase
MNGRLTSVVTVLVLIVASSCATREARRTPAVRRMPTPTPSPTPGEAAEGPAGAVKESLEESHEKSVEAAKEAAAAVKQGAAATGEAAKQAVESPAEAAKKAAEAAAQTTKEAALSFRTDMHHFPERLWVDLKAIPSVRTAVVLGLGGALAGISSDKWDDKIRRNVAKHPDRFGLAENNGLDTAANPYTVFGVSSAVYGTSLLFDSPRLHDFSLDMMSALTIDEPINYALKKAFHTRRPNGDRDGFPSGHAAAAMTLAALLQQHFGLYPALAGYTFAAFVGWHRIDDRKHDLSDVIFGSALGWAVGMSVGDTQELPLIQAHLVPVMGGTRTAGLGLEWGF